MSYVEMIITKVVLRALPTVDFITQRNAASGEIVHVCEHTRKKYDVILIFWTSRIKCI